MKIKESKCLEGLNENQKEVALNFKGPSIVLSGPGSGKTATIIRRVAYMIENGVKPNHILLMTFTNKAANEMKERIKDYVGENADFITVGTYHSICCRLLRKYASLVDYKNNFTIFDSEDTKNIAKKLVKGTYLTDIDLINAISSIKQNSKSDHQLATEATTNRKKMIYDLYLKYQSTLKKQNAMDFDDLIINTIKCLEKSHIAKEEVNNKYRFIIADEIQDSAKKDIKLLSLLNNPSYNNICLVGDEDQSIYGWRGASVEELFNFKDKFIEMKTFSLVQNYRCSQNIVNAAKGVIENNSMRINKDLFTNNQEGSPIIYMEEQNDISQSVKCSNIIKLLIKDYGMDYKDIAILYRTSNISRSIEESLIKSSIPYKIIGGVNFYARKEIKDILSYLRFIYNPKDFESFKRCITNPKRKIGDTTLDKIYEEFQMSDLNIIDICEAMTFSPLITNNMNNFIKQIRMFEESLTSFENVGKFIEYIVNETGYMDYIKEKEDNYEDRFDNIKELINFAYGYYSIFDFISSTSLDPKSEEEDENNKVQLLTMHAAKGLEYKAVIIVSANEKVIPHFRCLESFKLEEERRLFYVAMTRAKEYLFILSTKESVNRGCVFQQKASRFISEIDEQYIIK